LVGFQSLFDCAQFKKLQRSPRPPRFQKVHPHPDLRYASVYPSPQGRGVRGEGEKYFSQSSVRTNHYPVREIVDSPLEKVYTITRRMITDFEEKDDELQHKG